MPTTDTLVLPASLREAIGEHARSCYPAEACGFLIGAEDDRVASVTAVRHAVNTAARRDRFRIEPHEVFAAIRDARHDGRVVLGVYHSHPDGQARPSAVDEEEGWGEWLHLIVAAVNDTQPEYACWFLSRESGDNLRVVVRSTA